MTEYAKLIVSIENSTNTDYSRPFFKRFWDEEFSLDESVHMRAASATAAGKTYDLGEFSSVTWMVVHNTDATDSITVTYTASGGTGGSTANDYTLAPGEFMIVSDVTASADVKLVASANTPIANIWAWGT